MQNGGFSENYKARKRQRRKDPYTITSRLDALAYERFENMSDLLEAIHGSHISTGLDVREVIDFAYSWCQHNDLFTKYNVKLRYSDFIATKEKQIIEDHVPHDINDPYVNMHDKFHQEKERLDTAYDEYIKPKDEVV